MDSNRQTNEKVYDLYVQVQKQLWDRWMEIARQFEIATAPETAWWSYQFKMLNEPTQNRGDDGKSNNVWLELWKDGLDQHKGILAAMVEWNRRILEHRAEANRQFLAAWSEATRNLSQDQLDKSTRQAFQALQEAVNQTISTTPTDTMSAPVAKLAKKAAYRAKRLKQSDKKLPAVRIYPH